METVTKIPKRHEVDSGSFLSNHESGDDVGECEKTKEECKSSADLCGLGADTIFACRETPGHCPQENC